MITLELDPEIEARLAAQAKANGVDLATYAARVLTEALPAVRARTFVVGANNSVEQTGSSPDDHKPQRAPADIRAWLDRLAQFSKKIPAMPGQSFTREMIYQDHD